MQSSVGTRSLCSRAREGPASTSVARAWRGAFVLLASCGDTGETPQSPRADVEPWFVECAAESGIAFQHRSGHVERYYFPEIMTSGAALFDADGDGDLDLYLVQGGSVLVEGPQAVGNALYLNRGDGTFTDATEGSGADDRGYGMGAATGDYDADGDVDLYVT